MLHGLSLFAIVYVVGLDPARPLIKPGIQNRLDSGDAKSVQVMHTNAGYYGEGGRVGHVDFCVNGGKRQPYCSNTTSKKSSLNRRKCNVTVLISILQMNFFLFSRFFARSKFMQPYLGGMLSVTEYL